LNLTLFFGWMKVFKYLFWLLLVGGVILMYSYILNQPIGSKEFHQFRKLSSGKYISFYNIDNEAKVLVNDSIIFDSGIIDDNPQLNLNVELEPLLKEGKNFVRVELRNSDCAECPTTPWGIRYELIQDYEIVDYVEESSFDVRDTGGVKFEKTYEIFQNNK
jgi:hypothetical protein